MFVKKINILSIICVGIFLNLLFLGKFSFANNSDCYKDFFDVAKDGDFVRLEEFIKQGEIDINFVDKDGKTLLYIASSENNLTLVKFLLQNGAKKSIEKAFAGWTPLYNACYNNNLDMVRYLIENGAAKSVNVDNNIWKRTPLYWACRNNNLEMVKYLLSKGAAEKIDTETAFFGGTNLYWACYNGNLSMIKCLVVAGADINKVTTYNENLLYWACKFNNMVIFNYLLECWREKLFNLPDIIKITNKYTNESALYWASHNNNFDMVKILIDNGAKEMINDCLRDNNKTVLYWACYNNNFKMVRYLIDNGATIDQESLNISVCNSRINKYFHEIINYR